MSNKIHTAIRLQPPRKMESAPTDGTHIYVLNPNNNKLYIVYWYKELISTFNDEMVETGVWMTEDGWFEPDEVHYWYSMGTMVRKL